MKRLRVAVLTHEDLVPPASTEGYSEKEIQVWKREFGVVRGLRALGHATRVLGVSDDLMPIRGLVEEWKPDVIFNLLMEFQDVGSYQVHVVSYLELLNVPYTGCNPRGILLARDKRISKQIFRYHRIPSPAFAFYRRGRKVRARRSLHFPLFVKSVEEEASFGIAQASVVHDEEGLRARVEFVQRGSGTDAIAEEYVRGRELTISVLGNERLSTLPVWELFFKKLPEGTEPIATARVKWDLEYQKKLGIETGPAKNLPDATAAQIARIVKRAYRALGLSGYARMDLRLAEDGRAFVIEANATPDITYDEDLALSAKAAGMPYEQLLQRILHLALRYRPPWQQVRSPA